MYSIPINQRDRVSAIFTWKRSIPDTFSDRQMLLEDNVSVFTMETSVQHSEDEQKSPRDLSGTRTEKF